MSRSFSTNVAIQVTAQRVPAIPSWCGEVVCLARYLRKQGILNAISEQVRFARRRFGRYEVLNFVAVLFGYAIRILQAFYEHLHPYASSFMALFGRDRLPTRSTLSRFLAALTPETVEALRTLFLDDLLSRPLSHDKQTGGLVDRAGSTWVVFDIDGTREAARQRALPQTPDRPAPQRRLQPLCAPGYTGRKRGEVVRTRTTVLQAHTYQWLATFGNPGNGEYRSELGRAVTAIWACMQAYEIPHKRAILRLDGQYGTGAIVSGLVEFAFVLRGKDYQVLAQPPVQTRLHLLPDQQFTRPESPLCRTLYDCPVCPWDRRARTVGWWSRPILPGQRRAGWAPNALAWSMSCS